MHNVNKTCWYTAPKDTKQRYKDTNIPKIPNNIPNIYINTPNKDTKVTKILNNIPNKDTKILNHFYL